MIKVILILTIFISAAIADAENYDCDCLILAPGYSELHAKGSISLERGRLWMDDYFFSYYLMFGGRFYAFNRFSFLIGAYNEKELNFSGFCYSVYAQFDCERAGYNGK